MRVIELCPEIHPVVVSFRTSPRLKLVLISVRKHAFFDLLGAQGVEIRLRATSYCRTHVWIRGVVTSRVSGEQRSARGSISH